MVPMVIPFPSVWVTNKANTSTQSKAIPGLISIATKLPIVIILELSHRLMSVQKAPVAPPIALSPKVKLTLWAVAFLSRPSSHRGPTTLSWHYINQKRKFVDLVIIARTVWPNSKEAIISLIWKFIKKEFRVDKIILLLKKKEIIARDQVMTKVILSEDQLVEVHQESSNLVSTPPKATRCSNITRTNFNNR